MSVKVETGTGVDPYRDEKDGKLREIGNQAVWSLSSCKPGITFISCTGWHTKTCILIVNVCSSFSFMYMYVFEV